MSVQGLVIRVSGSGGLGFWAEGLGIKVYGLGLGFRDEV